MDRRIKAILVANNIYDLASVELVDYSDGILELVKNNKTQYISLDGRVYEEDIEDQLEEITENIFETKTQDEKVESVIEETKKDGAKVEINIFEEKKDEIDELFESKEKVESIDDFNINLDDDFSFDDEIKKELKKSRRTYRKKKKKSDDDEDLINLL